MKHQTLKALATVVALAAILMLGACKKKTAPPPPPPPPAAASPTAAISVSPDTVQRGQSATLTWQTSNATDVSIDGIGAVQASGSQSVTPSDSTTYHLVAKGSGGTQEATTRLTVTQPPPPPSATPSPTDEDMFGQNVKDIYFDYDKSNIRGDQEASAQGDAQFLSQHPNISFTIEGHCDDRGSTEYNLALGRPARQFRQERLDRSRHQCQPHQDHQLRQGETVLPGRQRSLLAAEPPRPLRLSEVVEGFASQGRSYPPPLPFHVLKYLPNPLHRQPV